MAEHSHTLAAYPPDGSMPGGPAPFAADTPPLADTAQNVPEFQSALDRQMKRLARRGVTQKEIASDTGIRISQLRAWRKGDSMPNKASFDKLRRFEDLCNLPGEYFVVRVCRDQGWTIPAPPVPPEGET